MHIHSNGYSHLQTQVCTDLAYLKDLKVILHQVDEAC